MERLAIKTGYRTVAVEAHEDKSLAALLVPPFRKLLFELDRVAGRYIDVKDELVSPRTVFVLSPVRPLNMFNLRQRYFFLRSLLDADYGSATFINSDKPASFEIRVSTTGLLIRDSQPQ
jgi:hypothetical protein